MVCRSSQARTLCRAALSVTLLAASCFLSACGGRETAASPSAPEQPPPPLAATCDASRAQFAVGSTPSANLLERARVAATAASARFIGPNDVVTLEFLASRLNLLVNTKGIVHGTYCG
jgi:hypothetical protein